MSEEYSIVADATLSTMLTIAHDRLARLEIQATTFGELHVPAHIPIQIDQTKQTIAGIEAELERRAATPSTRRAELPDALRQQAIDAAARGVGLVDQLYEELHLVLPDAPQPTIGQEHRLHFEAKGQAIVAREHNRDIRIITKDDLATLPESDLRHIQVYEKSMQNYYDRWEQAKLDLSHTTDAAKRRRMSREMKHVVAAMEEDLNGILAFLVSCGFYLDDHYQHVRFLVAQAQQ